MVKAVWSSFCASVGGRKEVTQGRILSGESKTATVLSENNRREVKGGIRVRVMGTRRKRGFSLNGEKKP